ncbi:MAG: phage head closure protein [Pseudomonadota bacterium]
MIRNNKNTSSSLRHRVTLQQEINTGDGAGGYVRSWQNVADLWAEISSANIKSYGQEKFFAGKIQAEITHKITIRYRAGITAAMRLTFENRIFNIRAVFNKDENNEILELLAEEGVAA